MSSGLTISAKWQALGCPWPRSTSAGSSSAQIGCAFQQRVRNLQPEGGLAGLGTSPSSTIPLRLPRCPGSSIGTAESSACVYGGDGPPYIWGLGPISTTLPGYITAPPSGTGL